MPYEMIAALMFSTMLLLMMTGQRVFGIIGFVAVVAAIGLWGTGGYTMGFSASMKLMKWYPLLSLPMFYAMVSANLGYAALREPDSRGVPTGAPRFSFGRAVLTHRA